jgi:putative peptidoglycan lipid II flippase
VNIALGLALFPFIGVQGIAAATGIAAWISVAQMAASLSRSGDYRPSARAWSKIARVALSSAGLGGVLLLAGAFRGDIEAALSGVALPGLGAKEIAVLLVCALGAALYPALLFAFGGITPAEAKAAMRRRRSDPPPAALP